MGNLLNKLTESGLKDVAFLIINEQYVHARAHYQHLRNSTAEGIHVYQHDPQQKDIWEILEGEKDDFLIYDRCGQLTFHIVMPYSFLHYPYVEAAIWATYNRDICGNCSVQSVNGTQLNVTEAPGANATTYNSGPLSGTPSSSLTSKSATPIPEGPDDPHSDTTTKRSMSDHHSHHGHGRHDHRSRINEK